MSTVGFKITGEFVTNHARDLWTDGRYGYAVDFLVDTLDGMTIKCAVDIILGSRKLVGINDLFLEIDNFTYNDPYYCKTIDAAILKLKNDSIDIATYSIGLLHFAMKYRASYDFNIRCYMYDLLDTFYPLFNVQRKKYQLLINEYKLLNKHGLTSKIREEIIPDWMSEEWFKLGIKNFTYDKFHTKPEKNNISEILNEEYDKNPECENEDISESISDFVESVENCEYNFSNGEWFSQLQQNTKNNTNDDNTSKKYSNIRNCWIMKNGDIIECGYEEHIHVSQELCKKYYNITNHPDYTDKYTSRFNAEEFLEKEGCIKISKCRLSSWTLNKVTQKQIDSLFDLYNAKCIIYDDVFKFKFNSFDDILKIINDRRE